MTGPEVLAEWSASRLIYDHTEDELSIQYKSDDRVVVLNGDDEQRVRNYYWLPGWRWSSDR